MRKYAEPLLRALPSLGAARIERIVYKINGPTSCDEEMVQFIANVAGCSGREAAETLAKVIHVYKHTDDQNESADLGTVKDPSGTAEASSGREIPVGAEEAVFVAKVKRRTTQTTAKAQERKAAEKQAKAMAQATLGMALATMVKLSKPRKIGGNVDEILWAGAMEKAKEEMATKFGGQQDWEGYYAKMCQIGRVLLAEEMHRLTQKIYDYRASKKFSRTKAKALMLQVKNKTD